MEDGLNLGKEPGIKACGCRNRISNFQRISHFYIFSEFIHLMLNSVEWVELRCSTKLLFKTGTCTTGHNIASFHFYSFVDKSDRN